MFKIATSHNIRKSFDHTSRALVVWKERYSRHFSITFVRVVYISSTMRCAIAKVTVFGSCYQCYKEQFGLVRNVVIADLVG